MSTTKNYNGLLFSDSEDDEPVIIKEPKAKKISKPKKTAEEKEADKKAKKAEKEAEREKKQAAKNKEFLPQDLESDDDEAPEIVINKTPDKVVIKHEPADVSPSALKQENIKTPNIEEKINAESSESYKVADAKFIDKCEVFDADKLAYILNNRAVYEAELNANPSKKARISNSLKFFKTCFGPDYDAFIMAEKYLSMSKDGKIDIKYKQYNNKGRYHSVGGIGLQGMLREIRQAISNHRYVDIDMVNAHPVILRHLCKLRGIKTPYLKKYVKNRDEILTSISDNRDTAKQGVLAMINGGTKFYNKMCDKKHKWVRNFGAELCVINKSFTADKEFTEHKKKREKAGEKFNHEGTYLNSKLTDMENNILMTILDELGNPKDCVLCFDGLMLPSEPDIKRLQNRIKEDLDIDIELKVKPMDGGFKLPDVIPKYIYPKLNQFDNTDSYCFSDFYNEFQGASFDSWESAESKLGLKYPRVINKILKSKGTYIKKSEKGGVDIIPSLKGNITDFNIYIADKTFTLADYLKRQKGYSDYAVSLDKCDDKLFNLWPGFNVKRTTAEGEGLELIKQFIFEVFASENQTLYNYLISWIAGLFRSTGINEIALVVLSNQGSGKDTLFSFITNMMMAGTFTECSGIDSITDKHNTFITNKRLIAIDEVSSTEGKDGFRGRFDKLKNMITQPHIMINPKGVDAFTIPNISNFWFNTNHVNSMYIEKSDRRYAIIRTSEKYIQNIPYFKNLRAKCFNQETYNAFYTYLLDFDMVDLRANIPTTEAKTEMINLSKPPALRFADAITTERLFEDMTEIQGAALYNKFVDWCKDNGERSTSRTSFGVTISTVLEKRQARTGVVYKLPVLPPAID